MADSHPPGSDPTLFWITLCPPFLRPPYPSL